MTGNPTITVLSLGGTISSAPSARTGLAGPQLSAADIIASVPGVKEIADVEVVDVARLPSSDIQFEHALVVADRARAAIAAGSSGVVVTQGTDTIEEMAFCLDLLVDRDIALAVTGAMRHSSLAGADGPANLLDALRTVAAPQARGLGCLVVFNEEIHAARDVRKTHTSSPGAFRSPGTGPLGWIAEGVPHLRERAYPKLTLSVAPGTPVPRPALVSVTMDDDGWWLTALRSSEVPGVVIAGTGGGHVPGWLAAGVRELATAMPVVLTSRTGGGEVLTSTYGGFAGSETALMEAGLIPGGSLHPTKARVLLALLLASGADRDEIRAAVATLAHPARRDQKGSS